MPVCPEQCANGCESDGVTCETTSTCSTQCKFGCKDDGITCADYEITLSSISGMTPGDTTTLTASFIANTILTATSSNDSCISVNSEATTGTSNSAKFSLSAIGSNCTSTIIVSADGAKSKTMTISVSTTDKPYIALDKPHLELNLNQTDFVTATYKSADGTPISYKELQANNSDASCVKAIPQSSGTNANGMVKINVIAVEKNCTSTITVSPAGETIYATFTVSVSNDGNSPLIKTPALEFSQSIMSVSPNDTTGIPVQIRNFIKEDNSGIAGKKVNVISSNQGCVYYKEVTNKTDNDGYVYGNLIPRSSDCSATITATTISEKAELFVTVTDKQEFSISGITIKAENSYDQMGYVGVKFADVSCSIIQQNLAAYASLSSSIVQPANRDGMAPIVHSFSPSECLSSGCFNDIRLDKTKAFVAIAASSQQNDDELVGWGCVDSNISMDYAQVEIALQPLHTDIKGSYDAVSNFDLTSAFPASSNSLTYVEKMEGGDWIAFVANLFKTPADTLYEFLFQNTIARLTLIPGLSDKIVLGINLGDLINDLANSDFTKDLGLAFLKPLLEEYLSAKSPAECAELYPNDPTKQQECTKASWYDILNEVGDDVEELVRNMQFAGKLTVDEVDGFNITTGTDNFNQLQYQWSYSGKDCPKIIKNAYAKENKKRCAITLNNPHYSAITGTWSGSLVETENTSAGDATLTINAHALSFKWVSILYAAVFNEILPTAINYTAFESKPLTAFMTKLLFEPIIMKYRTKYNNWSMTDEYGNPDFSSTCTEKEITKQLKNGSSRTTTFPCLQILTTSDYYGDAENLKCAQFFEAVIYMIAGDKQGYWQKVIPTAAEYACDRGLGALDELVWNKLALIEAGKQNSVMLSANSCTLYDENTIHYTKMGQEDSLRWTANEVFGPLHKETNRCEWNISVGEKSPMKGIFHATRNN